MSRTAGPPARRFLLGLALGAAVLALGSTWSSFGPTPSIGGGGTTILTNRYNPSTGDLDLVPTYSPGPIYPGSPGQSFAGFEDDMRVLLVPAAVLLALLLPTRPRIGRRWVRTVAVMLGVAGVWGLATTSGAGPLIALGAAALAFAADRDREPSRPGPTWLPMGGSTGPARSF